ncbi:M23 family metallopeptidase [Thiospirochaeta perfilievii]|nr:M23 family metallopeptidase [Thiospirochaeta perfilievii]
MVISLESQNVKMKRYVSYSNKRLINLKFKNIKIGAPEFRVPEIHIGINMYPYFIGLIMFLLIFPVSSRFFIPKPSTYIDIDSVILPENSADVESKKLIDKYGIVSNDDYFFDVTTFKGETLSALSVKYGVSIDTILQYNNITDIKKFSEYKKIVIPKYSGFNHKVQSIDSLNRLSVKYSVPVEDIFRVNSLTSESLSGLEWIFIPSVDPTSWGFKSNISRFFIYPLKGSISKRYGYFTNTITGITSLYEGIDFTSNYTDMVYASKGGYISRIGYSSSYGHYIYIDHTGGFRTLYAHLDKINVELHSEVAQGEPIGVLGNSGFTNSKKLFFSIFYRDKSVDPEIYLR